MAALAQNGDGLRVKVTLLPFAGVDAGPSSWGATDADDGEGRRMSSLK